MKRLVFLLNWKKILLVTKLVILATLIIINYIVPVSADNPAEIDDDEESLM